MKLKGKISKKRAIIGAPAIPKLENSLNIQNVLRKLPLPKT
jgi:hypothetical protein